MTAEANLSDALENRNPGHYHVPLDGGYLQAPVITVPAASLLYRPQNGRIAVEELAFLRRQGLPADFFAGKADDPGIQGVLEKLLLEIARDSRGPIYAELARAKQQTEPLIVNRDRVVINGNRRLVAMRTLYAEDPKEYATFENVEVAVLPEHLDEAAEERIEAALQIAPDTKLAYGWIHRRLKLRRQRDELMLPQEAIVQSYRLENARQLSLEIAQLELAEEYLETFLDSPGEYERLADDEALFVGLQQWLTEPGKGQARVWKLAGFSLILARNELDVALESYFPFARPRPPHAPTVVLNRLGAEIGLWPHPSAAEARAMLGRENLRALQAALSDANAAAENACKLVNLLDAVVLEERERRAPGIAVRRLREVSELMNGTDISTLSPKELGALKSQLATVEYQARRLREVCEAYDSRPQVVRQYHWLRRHTGRLLRALRLR